MNIYIYSDESGVFDYVHYDYFVFGGLIVLSKEDKQKWINKYIHAEKAISHNYKKDIELKATAISNKDKSKLFRSLNECYKFGTIINQQKVRKEYFGNKKTKQRYLDYAYKIAVKRALEDLIRTSAINPNDQINMYFYVDEHTTATDGIYELEQALLQEFKEGTYNFEYQTFYKPILKNIDTISLKYCDSKTQPLVRAADIIANKLHYYTVTNQFNKLEELNNIVITQQP